MSLSRFRRGLKSVGDHFYDVITWKNKKIKFEGRYKGEPLGYLSRDVNKN